MITSRMKKVIRILLNHDEFITISHIAEEISVSTRTILRELDDISDWIETQGGSLEKKKGTGILLKCGKLSKAEFLSLLKEEKGEVIYMPTDRGVMLRAKLLQFNEPTKLYALTSLLHVTESTIAGDLQQQEAWFTNYQLEIIKKPGLGIELKGSEKAKRKAIVALIYEHFQLQELINVIIKGRKNSYNFSDLEKNINSLILELLDVSAMPQVKSFIEVIEKEMGFQVADNGYIALAIRIGVTLKRKNFWNDLELNKEQITSIINDKMYKIAIDFLDKHQEHPLNVLPQEELVYMIMHLKGTKLSNKDMNSTISMIDDFRVIQIVKEFVSKVEAETGAYLVDNESLIMGLVKHLRPALFRMRMELDIINPLLDEIKQNYSNLFQTVKYCAKVIEEKGGVIVPDDEIAYLSTHIGAVLHKNNLTIEGKYKAIVACMYGIGASQFLLTQLKKYFPNIEVVKVISVIDEEAEHISEMGADVLISTIPITVENMPTVLIQPVLSLNDVDMLNKQLNALTIGKNYKKQIKSDQLKEKLESFTEYAQIILKLMDNYQYDFVELKHMKALIEYVSFAMSKNKDEQEILTKAFIRREEKGSTILAKKGMLLLHCRADIDKELALQIIHLSKPIDVMKDTGFAKIQDVVVMVGPVKLNQKILEVLSEVSRNIIAESFSDIICGHDKEQIEIELSSLLEKFYEKLVLTEG